MVKIHINSHFAIGVIIASLFNHYFNFTLLEFSLIVITSFINDFDVFFSKYAKDHNHRNLVSHSIIPGVIIFSIGMIFDWSVLIVCGFVYFVHIFVDTLDWGTNFFYFPKKTFGLRFLMPKVEEENLSKYLANYRYPESYFDFKYYNNKICMAIEIILFILMIIFVVFLAFEYIIVVLFYFLGLYFHLSRHFYLKKIEAK